MFGLKTRKGVSPMLVIVAIIAFLSLDIIDKDFIYREEYSAALAEKNVYTIVHTAELFERTVETATYFSAKKALFETSSAGLNWGTASPTDSELKEVLEKNILRNIILGDEKINNVSLDFDRINLEMSLYSEHGIRIEGEALFSLDYTAYNFRANLDSAANFNHSIGNKYFKLAKLVRETADCSDIETGERQVNENSNDKRYLITTTDMGNSNYQIVAQDNFDPSPLGEGLMNITTTIDCN